MKIPTDKKVIIVFIIGAVILLSILIILVSLSTRQEKTKVNKPKFNNSQSKALSPATSFNKEPTIIPTQKTIKEEEINYDLIRSKLLAYIETQKNGSFYKLSNNNKEISYQASAHVASTYYYLYQTRKDPKYIQQAIDLAFTLITHCQDANTAKDCYFVLTPFFELYSYNKSPLYLAFLKTIFSQLETYTPRSLNAYARLADEYFRYYFINFDEQYYQKAMKAYQKALDLLPQFPHDIGLLFQNQQGLYMMTNDSTWLKASKNFFNSFDQIFYNKMNASQRIFVLTALQNLKQIEKNAKYSELFKRLLREFVGSHLNKNQGFVCFQSSDCANYGLSQTIDNSLFLDLLIYDQK